MQVIETNGLALAVTEWHVTIMNSSSGKITIQPSCNQATTFLLGYVTKIFRRKRALQIGTNRISTKCMDMDGSENFPRYTSNTGKLWLLSVVPVSLLYLLGIYPCTDTDIVETLQGQRTLFRCAATQFQHLEP